MAGVPPGRMATSLRRLAHAMVPGAVTSVLSRWPARYGRISQGPGAGLRFDAGPGNPAYRTGANELPVQTALAEHLGSGDVFYDIGANVGFFTVLAARLVGDTGAVYAFEPVETNAACIRRNVARNGFENVTVVPKAVSDRTGQDTLFLAEYAGGSALSVAAPPPDVRGTMSVPVVSVDDLLDEGAVRPPTLVKIDVEGAEAHVLAGMGRTLHQHRPILVFELDDRPEPGLAAKQRACDAHLHTAGYVCERLADSYSSSPCLVAHFLARPL